MDDFFTLFFFLSIVYTSSNTIAYYYKSSHTNILYLPINWTEVARVRSASKSDQLHFIDDFKYSTCDVTAHSCDVYCCNDSDCSVEQMQIFHCLEKGHETEVTMHLKSLDCHRSSYWVPSWFPLLCYEKNNSPVLGFKYSDIKLLESQADFQKLVNQERFYKFPDYHNHDFSSNIINDRSYIYGSGIQVYSDYLKEMSLFELPYPSFSRLSCSTYKPVQFLSNSSWECKQSLSAEECNSPNSALNLMNFAISGKNDSIWQLAGFYPPKLIKNLKEKSVAEVFVQNVCFKNVSDLGYFTKVLFKLVDKYTPLPQYEEYIVECGKHLELLRTSYDANTGVCKNVLVGAEFIFGWSGSEIVRLNVTYVLTDVAVSSVSVTKEKTFHTGYREFIQKRKNLERNKVNIAQMFNVQYISHSKKLKNSGLSEEYTLRSGNPGYILGKPLISGKLRLKPSKEGFNSSHRIGEQSILWQTSSMSIWISDNSCGSKTSVLFGMDSSSSCTVELSYDVFKNCSALREKVHRLQEFLVPAEWVARGGDLTNLSSPSSLVPVIRANGNSSTSEGFKDGYHAPMTCGEIPSRILIHILYEDSNVDRRNSELSAFYFVEGVSVSLETQNWTWIWSDRGNRAFRLVSSVTYTLSPTPEERSTNRFWLDLPQDSWLRAVNFAEIPAMDGKAVATVAPVVLTVALLLCRRGLMGHSSP